MQINWTKTIWSQAKHNAFTDLCEFQGHMFCCFREAKDHLSGDGKIRILRLDKDGTILATQILHIPHVDLRDPKLSETPEGKLLLIAYARHRDEDNKTLYAQPVNWFSGDGYSWSSVKYFADKNWWLWRLRWHKGQAMGFAYNRGQQAINLYQGDPRRTFDLIKHKAFSLANQGKGYPNESDIIFTDDDTAYALIRRDTDSCTAQLGKAKPPYKRWQWLDLGEYIGGPVMLKLDPAKALVAGRYWQGLSPRTALFELELASAKLELKFLLPSAGDCSYPGLLLKGKVLYMSYYSSHIDNKSKIYLAHFSL